MAINQNHLFEELDGIKCAIVEKNASEPRIAFLRPLLEFNGYTVVVIPSPPPKTAAKTPEAPIPPAAPAVPTSPAPPQTFTIGVTDITFNPVNAIFGRLLRTPDGPIVTLAYWQGTDDISHDEIPYFETR